MIGLLFGRAIPPVGEGCADIGVDKIETDWEREARPFYVSCSMKAFTYQ